MKEAMCYYLELASRPIRALLLTTTCILIAMSGLLYLIAMFALPYLAVRTIMRFTLELLGIPHDL